MPTHTQTLNIDPLWCELMQRWQTQHIKHYKFVFSMVLKNDYKVYQINSDQIKLRQNFRFCDRLHNLAKNHNEKYLHVVKY